MYRYFEYMEQWNRLEKEKKMETGRGKASPSVSIKDRTVVGPADHV